MKRLLLVAIITIVAVSAAFAGPFGIELGWGLQDLENNGIRYQNYPDEKFAAVLPPFDYMPLPYYFVDYDADGIYCITAVTDDITTKSDGTELWGMFNGILKDFCAMYGLPNQIVDYYADAELKKPANFMAGLANGAIRIGAFWFIDKYAILLNIVGFEDMQTGAISCEVWEYKNVITYFEDLRNSMGSFFPQTKADLPW